jgi:deoxyribodipyrimidine photo-lyase
MERKDRALMLFRRDLRLTDNSALNAALQRHSEVLPCFIFNPAQVNAHPYRSSNGLRFMIESLEELASSIALADGEFGFGYGETLDVLSRVLREEGISDLYLNKDYTPFSRARDKSIADLCQELGVRFHSLSDALLVEPSQFGKPDGGAYTVYTPFAKRAAQHEEVRRPFSTPPDGKFVKPTSAILKPNPREFWPPEGAPSRRSLGGRSRGLQILDSIAQFSDYQNTRDFPSLDATTILSPHNKFGTLSIREVYWRIADAFGTAHTLIRELYWRDFFTHIAWHFPHVFGGAFHSRLNTIQWENNEEFFERWCQGKTGFPIVDAGMRELVNTGFMHNRVRMIVASFLTKDLLVDWRKGEAFFAQHLTEYDPSVNNGSWQWAASTGCDAQPYFRIFNPWLQQAKFDPEALYIKRWIPELSGLQSKAIHNWQEGNPGTKSALYPQPIVDHAAQKILALSLFKSA